MYLKYINYLETSIFFLNKWYYWSLDKNLSQLRHVGCLLQDCWKMRWNEQSNEALLIKSAFSLEEKKAFKATAQLAGNSSIVLQFFWNSNIMFHVLKVAACWNTAAKTWCILCVLQARNLSMIFHFVSVNECLPHSQHSSDRILMTLLLCLKMVVNRLLKSKCCPEHLGKYSISGQTKTT